MHILNKVFDKVFVINLERCPDRKQHIIDQLEGVQYEFIAGIDGMTLNMSQLIEEGIWDRDRCERTIRRGIHMGEVGCAMAHMKIYRKMVDENISNALILEDDIEIYHESIEAHLEEAISQLPAKWDLLYLGYQQDSRLKYSSNLKRASIHDGAFGYSLTLPGAKKIIKSHTPMYHNADGILNRMCQMNDFSAFIISPRLLEYTKKFKSSIWYDE